MKHRMLVRLSLLGLLMGCSLQMLAQAQTVTFKASVPFPFVVGTQTLPAGNYQIQRLMGKPSETDRIGIIVLRSTEGRAYRAVVTNLVQSSDEDSRSMLTFSHRDGQHYLSSVSIAGEKPHQIPNAPQELEEAGVNSASPAQVALASR
jgi:hypothetical protein